MGNDGSYSTPDLSYVNQELVIGKEFAYDSTILIGSKVSIFVLILKRKTDDV